MSKLEDHNTLQSKLKKLCHTFKLPGQQIPEPPLQQWSNAPHEEEPHSPTRTPEATTWTFAHRTLIKNHR